MHATHPTHLALLDLVAAIIFGDVTFLFLQLFSIYLLLCFFGYKHPSASIHILPLRQETKFHTRMNSEHIN